MRAAASRSLALLCLAPWLAAVPAGCADRPDGARAVSRITDLKVIDAGQSTTVALDPGYQLLASITGDTVGGSLNGPLWNDAVPASHVYLAYRHEVTGQATGLGELHVSSRVTAVIDGLFGGTGGAGHDARYGAGQAGCQANAGVDLNSGTCAAAGLAENDYCYGNAIWLFVASCSGPGTELELHYLRESGDHPAVGCVALGNAVAVDANQPMGTRVQRLYWGPADANQDGAADAADAAWVLQHVQWIKAVPSGELVNLNAGTQSYCRYNYSPYCGGYDDGWIHAADAAEDAVYLGYCVP